MKDYITIQKLAVYIKFIITLILFISVKDFSIEKIILREI